MPISAGQLIYIVRQGAGRKVHGSTSKTSRDGEQAEEYEERGGEARRCRSEVVVVAAAAAVAMVVWGRLGAVVQV